MADTFQWRRCDTAGQNCVDLPGETASTHVYTAGDVGARLRVAGFRDLVYVGLSDPTAIITDTPYNPVTRGGIGSQRFNAEVNTADGYDRYDVISTTRAQAPAVAALSPGPRITSAYMAAVDCNTGFDVGIPYSQANANQWLLTTTGNNATGTRYTNAGYPDNYILDVALLAVQQAFVTNVLAFCSANGITSIYVDDVLGDTQLLLNTGGYPAKYPTRAAWQTALRSWVAYVGPHLQAAGIYIFVNASSFTPGDPNSNSATNDINWWNQIGTYLDGLQKEYFLQDPVNVTTLYQTGGFDYLHQWVSWQSLVATAQTMGADFYGLVYGSNSKNARFTRGSFLLDWDGEDGAILWSPTYQDPWGVDWTVDVGAIAGSKTVVGTGYKRAFSLKTVYVNPIGSAAVYDGHAVPATDAVFV